MNNRQLKSRSPWHLSKQQVALFDQQGYLVLPGRISPCQLNKLRQYADDIQAVADNARRQKSTNSDFVFTYRFLQYYLNRVLHFHLYAGPASLTVLGSPQLLAIADSLCGHDFTATVDMMIQKNHKDTVDIPWHQDLIYPSERYRVIAVGIYLEDSAVDDDALQLVPNSHHKKQNICDYITNPPDNITRVAAKAGDIVVHSPMLVHCSKQLTAQAKRRTLYYEFRPTDQLRYDETWPEPLIQRRHQLLSIAVAQHRQAHPDIPQFEFCQTPIAQYTQRPLETDLTEILQEIYQAPIPFNSANFCDLSTLPTNTDGA